jgi:hypothetical protein
MRAWHWGTVVVIVVVLILAYHWWCNYGGMKSGGPAATQNA